MNTIKRDYRLDDIVEIIRRAKHIEMSDLAELTGKSTRTIRSDVKRIKKDYPNVITRRGNGGGVFWIGDVYDEIDRR